MLAFQLVGLVWFLAIVITDSYRISWGPCGVNPSGLARLMPRLSSVSSKVTFPRVSRLHAIKRYNVMKDPVISPSEQELFDLLLKVVADCKLNTTVRVAGGWVRDRLLRTSNQKFDVDIALENMSGVEFRQHLQSWLRTPQGQVPHPFRLAVVPLNSDKSKHLETGMHHYCPRINVNV